MKKTLPGQEAPDGDAFQEIPFLNHGDLCGLGLTAEEIARSPEIGAWAESAEISSGAAYVEKLRRGRPRYIW